MTFLTDRFTECQEDSLVRICGGFAPPIPDPPIKATGTTFGATEGVTFMGIVAKFTDPDPWKHYSPGKRRLL